MYLLCRTAMQVYTMPVFEAVEGYLQRHYPALDARPVLLRLTFRSFYVLLAALVAAVLPFFGDLMGLIGAIGFTPMTFVMPAVLWLVAMRGRPLWERALNWTIVVVYTLIGVLALIGAIGQISRQASDYEFLS